MKLWVFVVTSKRKKNIYFNYKFSVISRQNDYTLRKGTTEVLSTNVKKIEFDVVNETVKPTTGSSEAMELA